MTQTEHMPAAFLAHLRTEAAPLILRRDGQSPAWTDLARHAAVYAQDPELYALLAVGESVAAGQQARVLFTLLRESRVDLPAPVRPTLERVTACLLAVLHPDLVLTVFLALRRARANHKHTAHAILRYILDHPQLEDLIRRRRPTVADALEHALGKNTARGAVRLLGTPGGDEPYVRRTLLRFARDPERVRAALPQLYGAPPDAALVPPDAPRYTDAHTELGARMAGREQRPKTVTATNRGDIAATLVHLYSGGPSPVLEDALAGSIAEAAARLPRFGGRLAVVLDTSASTRGYGDRAYCGLAQSVALTRVLARTCADLRVYPAESAVALPQPAGATDLAGPLLDALAGGPDLVAIVSDGYENQLGGDLARVAASLPAAGVATPVVFCHSKFSYSDDLTYRQPAPALPQMAFWHQADFEELLLQLFALAEGAGTSTLRTFLSHKLSQIEKEVTLWTSSS
ncbi:MAG TPA: VWA domain-containing protein [Chloroflexia bacterium]|nr:VWA domain-containing protein [Chloroflexia bacterium]